MAADGERFADIIARADVGLVLAKRSGRDRVVTA
jgi:PleD family two-component response regulator